jgi:hypothetical protein
MSSWSTPREAATICMSPLDAARHVVEDYPHGSGPAMALLLGKSWETLRKELAGAAGYKLGLSDALKITTRSGDLRILDAWEAEVGRFALPLPQLPGHVSDEALGGYLGQLSREFGEVVLEVSARAADGEISDRDVRAVEEQWGQLVAAGDALMRHLVRRNAAAKPSSAEVQP